MKTTRISIITLCMAAAMFLTACSKDPSPDTAKNDSVNTAAAFDWKTMSHEAKKKYMKDVVVKEMQTLFHGFDPEHFEKVTCKTCHGQNHEQDSFKMPSKDIEKLPATAEGWKKLSEGPDSLMLKFMGGTVKPKMAALLHLVEFNPQTNTGEFGCNNCHMTEGQ